MTVVSDTEIAGHYVVVKEFSIYCSNVVLESEQPRAVFKEGSKIELRLASIDYARGHCFRVDSEEGTLMSGLYRFDVQTLVTKKALRKE